MAKRRVGICVYKEGLHIFRNAWKAAGLEPDKVLRGAYGKYYIVWDHIIWNRTFNPRTKPFCDLMACLDQTNIRIERSRTKKVVPYMLHLLPQAKEEYQNKKGVTTTMPDEEYLSFYLEEHYESYLYACIAVGSMTARGYTDLDFGGCGGLPIPDLAIPIIPDYES